MKKKEFINKIKNLGFVNIPSASKSNEYFDYAFKDDTLIRILIIKQQLLHIFICEKTEKYDIDHSAYNSIGGKDFSGDSMYQDAGAYIEGN